MTLRRSRPFWARKKKSDQSIITTNLNAFYSFRQLPGYSGNCIEIERSSDNATQNIGFVSGYVDTDSISSFCSGTTGKIRTWYEQTGNSSSLQNTTHSTQPIIFQSGAITSFNGKTAMLCASNNFLSLISGSVESKSIFAVFKMNSFLTVSYFSWFSGGILLNANLAGYDGFARISGSNAIEVSNNSENTNENILSVFGNPDKKILNNNSNEATAPGTFTDFSFRNIGRPGTTAGMAGYLKEIMIYVNSSNYSDKDLIIGEINSYYSIY